MSDPAFAGPHKGSVYKAVHEPRSSLIGGWHVYRNDPGESATQILAQGMSEEEARATVDALNLLSRVKSRTP